MTKKFVTSVANVYFLDDSSGTELFRGTTLIDSSIAMKMSMADVRGGKGNALLYTYFHTGEFSVQINDAVFNLNYLASAVGSTVSSSTNIFKEETVTLGVAGAGTITGTPLALPGATTIYSWVLLPNQTVEKVTMTGSNFTSALGTAGQVVCVRYYCLNAATTYLTINSELIPAIGHLVMEANLNSSDTSTNKIGTLTIDIPKFQISSDFTIQLKSDSVAALPLSGRALRSENLESAACLNVPVFATIKETIDAANWYDGILALAFSGGDFGITAATSPKTPVVYAIPTSGAAFIPPVADLTFTSATPAVCTVGANTGVVSYVGNGTTLLKVVITARNTIEGNAVVTGT